MSRTSSSQEDQAPPTSAEWVFFALLHNFSAPLPIGNEHIAIASKNDLRIAHLRKKSLTFHRLVDGFTDTFGKHVEPSLLLVRKGTPLDERITAFRNALAVSAIVKAWESSLSGRGPNSFLHYSNYFDLYPYYQVYEGLSTFTPAHGGVVTSENLLKQFRGQPSAALSISHPLHCADFFDKELFEALSKEWTRCYVKKKTRQWETIALFRSLEMAYRACAIPFWNEANIHDYGTTLSLWVSAFEILSHPETGYGGKEEVLDLLGQAVFSEQKLRHQRYQIPQGKKKPPRQVTLVQKTYYEMNNARNNFLHGNPIKSGNLFPNRDKKSQPLTVFAPIIYKCALMAFLGLFERPTEELVPFQRWALEDALLRIRKPAEEKES